ncbi:MAG: hypothetical protein MUF45_17970 [Spirosomaceae bacterium]|jgi:uncharacterized protein (TIGR02646 family)|nr:hypothetical protein [Spirosomataceae bacterium]
MRKIVRTSAPNFLTESLQKDWGKQYRKNREDKGTSFEFKWPQLNNEKLNHKLLPYLNEISQKHCFYCDAYPTKSYGERIDHFKPKSNPLYYEDVCVWENLYLCCDHCNSYKKEQFDEKMIRPDDLGYKFDDYFEYNAKTGEIDIKLDISAEKQERAKITCKILGFNEGDKPEDRKRFFRLWHNDPDKYEFFDSYNFRFIFDNLMNIQP